MKKALNLLHYSSHIYILYVSVNIKETALRNVKQIFIWHHFACLWRALFYTWHCSEKEIWRRFVRSFFYEYKMICTIMVQLNAFTLLKVMCLYSSSMSKKKKKLKLAYVINRKKRPNMLLYLNERSKKNMKRKLFLHKYIFPFMIVIIE